MMPSQELAAGTIPKIPERVGRRYRKAKRVGTKTTVMKKACLIVCIALMIFQQNGFSQDVRVGVTGGLTISDISSPYNEMNHSVKTGFVGGMIIDMPIGNNFSFQPQLNYVQKGNLFREDANQKIFYALRYAETLLNFTYTLNPTGKTNFYVGAGPSLSFNLPSKKVTKPKEGESNYVDVLFGKTIENDFKGFDYGVNIVGGMRFGSTFLGVFYNMGLRNLNPREADDDIKNRCFGIQLGYLFKN